MNHSGNSILAAALAIPCLRIEGSGDVSSEESNSFSSMNGKIDRIDIEEILAGT
jgi:hypothetical protein